MRTKTPKLIGLLLLASISASADPRVQGGSCHDWSRTDWMNALNTQISAGKKLDSKLLDRAFQKCAKDIEKLGLAACTARLREYVTASMATHRGDMGFAEPDSEYYKKQPQELMQLPPELQNGIPPFAELKKLADSKGWLFVEIWEPSGGIIPKIILEIPGEKSDMFLNITHFGAVRPKDKFPLLVDMLVMQKIATRSEVGTRPGTVLDQPIPRFRELSAPTFSAPLKLTTGSPSQRCLDCHINGPLKIFPHNRVIVSAGPRTSEEKEPTMDDYIRLNALAGGHPALDTHQAHIPLSGGGFVGNAPAPKEKPSAFSGLFATPTDTTPHLDPKYPATPTHEARLKTLNENLMSYGLIDWAGTHHPDKFGPALGKSASCTDCHNGKQRRIINQSADFSQTVKLRAGPSYGLIRDQMPIGKKFDSDKEGEQFVKNIYSEYSSEFKQWIGLSECAERNPTDRSNADASPGR